MNKCSCAFCGPINYPHLRGYDMINLMPCTKNEDLKDIQDTKEKG